MRRRGFVAAAAALPLAAALAGPARAQQARTHRIGWLCASPTSPGMLQAISLFSASLVELGHVEGRNLVVERRYADGGIGELPRLASELIDSKVDVIVTDTTPAAAAAHKATKSIPIVMAVSVDPVEQGLVASLARPAGNVTGLTFPAELEAKRLEFIRALLPNATRLAVLARPPGNPVLAARRAELEGHAKRIGLATTALEIRGAAPDFEALFAAAASARAQGLMVLADPSLLRFQAPIVALAAHHRLPAMYYTNAFVHAGGLMSYSPDIGSMFRRAAGYVDRILRGGKPADLPVEHPTKFELMLNAKTADALGVKFPPALLNIADEVLR